MNFKNILALITAVALAASLLSGCGSDGSGSSSGSSGPVLSEDEFLAQGGSIDRFDENDVADGGDDELLSFRPVDCGIQAQDEYDFPFIGLRAVLSKAVLDGIEARDIFVMSFEDYPAENSIDYALLRFSLTTQEQKDEYVTSIDIFEWENSLEKLGALGVYSAAAAARLDELTGCDRHEKLGESADGKFEYYLSTSSSADTSLAAELAKTEATIYEMHQLDMSMGYSAFSTDRIDGVANVGKFTTQDIFGNSCTQDIFSDYDISLVNVFATWCSPCVEEIPELEQLRQSCAEKGIKLGVVAVVLDAKTASGVDEQALELARTLYERSGAQFPFLIADDGDMNGRLVGIASVPESFFVDSNGNIVSDPYVGARSADDWADIVERELSALRGEG